LLGKRDTESTTATLGLMLGDVLPREHPMNEFSLVPSPTPPLNLFVPLDLLQDAVLISAEDRRALARNQKLIEDRTRRANAALSFRENVVEANEYFMRSLDLEDWGLKLRVKRDPPYARKVRERNLDYISVESDRMLLEPAILKVIEQTAQNLQTFSSPTTAYLANDIEWEWRKIPYSIVASVNPEASPPLGPFLPKGYFELAEDEILLADWPASPLREAKQGDPITLRFFDPDLETGVKEVTATFRLAGRIPLTGIAADPNLTPPFPGITDRLLMNDWKPPFPYDNTRIKSNDIFDQFWQDYRTTPKAYITRAAGERLFGSRFGNVTTLRVAPLPGKSVEQSAEELRVQLRSTLDPALGGFELRSTQERLAAAAKGGTDFGIMLLMFSFLLIAAALLLVGLLFRLNVDKRSKEVGLLLACGYSPGRVLRILLIEGILLAVVGAGLGVGLSLLYAEGMIVVLGRLWPDGQISSYLNLHVAPGSLIVGFISAVLVAGITIWVSLRKLVRIPPPMLLRGQTEPSILTAQPPRLRLQYVLTGVCLVAGIGSVVAGGFTTNSDLRAGAFFSGGGLLMMAGLIFFRTWLIQDRPSTIGVQGGLTAFGLRSATRNSTRSLLTAALIAFATFLLVAVESFRKKPGEEFAQPTGGSGGFRFLAQTEVPLFQPPDDPATRAAMLDELQTLYQRKPSTAEAERGKAEQALKSLTSLSFRFHGGDDASCLNLYQAGTPRVVGVPDALLKDPPRFAFAQTEASTPAEKANPWTLLTKKLPEDVIPVIAEQNTVLWQLKTFVGSEILVSDETGRNVRLRIVGTLQDSVFQSELLIADEHFRKLYPRTEGFRLFLIDTPAEYAEVVPRLLTSGLRRQGLQITPTADKVAVYQAVIGAYLSTFQLLGGFGLLLGILGLGVVILRAVFERQGELALLRSIGFAPSVLQRLALTENLLLLLVGMSIGTGSAVLSVLPNLAFGASIPWLRFGLLLGLVFLAGFLMTYFATRRIARTPLIPALRKE
jgi:ABC-type lipoprotein release transport system permease subunit